MAIKKSDLYSSLWRSCDELRGGMDASQYKDYILVLLFVKYVSDKAKSDPDSLITVPAGAGFDDMATLAGDPEIGDKFNKIVARLAEVNKLEKVIDVADFNDPEKLGRGKEMQDRLSKLIRIFAGLDFSSSKASGDDLLGDAYEYLMRHFATESGKSKGQFYTPAEVSRVLAKVIGIGPETRQDQTAYDPTCGSGSLLLKLADEAPRGLTLYGQEKDGPTWALSVMNMVLHGNATAEVLSGDTITSPRFIENGQLKTFDFCAMNPPFSLKSWSNGLENEYDRFELGRPPKKNGDYAFLLHVLKSLKSTGKAAVILPHGVLFRGNAEGAIRKNLLSRGVIKGIVGLPANLFYGTGIPACVIVIDKENAQARRGVFMINASTGFMKDGAKNRLRSQDIHKIVDVFTKQTEVEGYSRLVPISEILAEGNEGNLNIPRYISSTTPVDVQDLQAHLNGGIPDRDLDLLEEYWSALPELRGQLFESNRPGYASLAIDPASVHEVVLSSPDFHRFSEAVSDGVVNWFTSNRQVLADIGSETRPAELVAALGEDLLARFASVPVLDQYDVYENLMSYWHDVMHDDVFMVMSSGWVEAARPRRALQDAERKLSETPDLVLGPKKTATKYKMDLVPPALVEARYFAEQRKTLAELAAVADGATSRLAEFAGEHAVEDGLLAGAMEDEKITKAQAASRLKEAKAEGEDDEEVSALQSVVNLFEAETAAKKAVKDARALLDAAVLQKYETFSADDVQRLVLDDKWNATISGLVLQEVDALMRTLVSRICVLGDRYGVKLEELVSQTTKHDEMVMSQLLQMGFS